MAPPGKRRFGFSRRAQYGLFLGYVLSVGGVIVAVLLLAVAIVDPQGFGALKGPHSTSLRRSQAGRSVVRFFGGIGDGMAIIFAPARRTTRFAASSPRPDVNSPSTSRRTTRIGGCALARPGRSVEDEVALARITGSSFDSPRRLATLSAGSSSGIRPGQPVRAPEGLIGRVLETGRWASRVLLITDGASSVPVRLPRDGTPALAVGRGDGTIELRTLEVGTNPFRPGDVLVTSGVGGIFPPDVPVARVIRIEGDTAIARPVADPARIDFAIVQRAYQPAATGRLDYAPAPVVAPPVARPPPAPRPGHRQSALPARLSSVPAR